METHLIIVPSDFTGFQVLSLIDTYLSSLSKEKIRFRKNERRVIVDSLNMQFYFRKNSYQLIQFVDGMKFRTVRILNCCINDKVLHELYMRSEEIKLERMKLE